MIDYKTISVSEIGPSVIEQFRCTDETRVEHYLKNEAIMNENHHYTRTKLIVKDGEVIGYFSLFNEMVEIGRKKATKNGWYIMQDSYNTFPAVRLHYLGVEDTYRNQGYGKIVLAEAMKLVLEITKHSGCMFIVVQVINNNAIGFFEAMGFETLVKKKLESEIQVMALKLSDIISASAS